MRRITRLAVVLLAVVATRNTRIRDYPERVGFEESDEPLGYDLRKGASSYAPIIGAIAGFVVPAVVLIFEIAASNRGEAVTAALGRATALLVLGLLGCLLGAFAFAAIGAERRLTANLSAATLHAGAATVVGVVAIIAAFEALAVAFLPETRDLFVWITAGTAIGGTVLVSMVLGDAWVSAPSGHWLSTRGRGYLWGSVASGLATLLLVGSAISYSLGVRIVMEGDVVHWFVGVGIVLALLGGLGSAFRTMHGPGGNGKPLGRGEAAVVLTVLVVYLSVMLMALP